MPTNVEIKAVVRDWSRTSEAAETFSNSPVEILEQEDTFYLDLILRQQRVEDHCGLLWFIVIILTGER